MTETAHNRGEKEQNKANMRSGQLRLQRNDVINCSMRCTASNIEVIESFEN